MTQGLISPEKRIARYHSKVDKREPDECWPWTGACDKDGYGVIHIQGRHVPAHRFGFALLHSLSSNQIVRHTCDNPPCQNPAHWLAGTQADNVRDMDERGRANRHPPVYHGADNPRAKLSQADVDAIRASSESTVSLARCYGVSRIQIGNIKRHRSWAPRQFHPFAMPKPIKE